MKTIHVCRVLTTLFILFYVVALLRFGEAADDLGNTQNACLQKFQNAQKTSSSSLGIRKNKDGTRSLSAKRPKVCTNLRALEADDCRCLLQESLRATATLSAKRQEILDILELLDVDTGVGTKCNIANNLDCSNAAQRVITRYLPQKDTKLQNALRSQYMACERKAKQLQMASAGCTSFMVNTTGNDTLLNQCCGVMEASGLDKDCTCLLLENDKASPEAKITRSGKQLIDLLKFVSSNEQIGSTCGSAVGIGNPECSGVAKAIRLGAVTTPNDLKDPTKCESAAKVAMDSCGVALQGVGGGGLESMVCCGKLEGLSKDDCGCKLGSVSSIDNDLGHFIKRVRSGGEVATACPNSALGGTLNCSVPTSVKDTVLWNQFMACERKAKQLQTASAGCTSFMANTAVGDDTLLNQCCGEVEASGLDKECTCLLLENDKASPEAKITQNGKQLIDLLTFISTNDQMSSTCGSAAVGNPECSGVAKALQQVAGTTQDDLKDPMKCVSAARDAMNYCGPSATLQGGGVETLACCTKLEGLAKDDCGCKLGNVITIDRDLGEFIKVVRSSDEVVKACPNSSLGSTRSCSSAAEVKVFEDCELKAREVMDTCKPLVEAARRYTELGLDRCCSRLYNTARSGCLCNSVNQGVRNGVPTLAAGSAVSPRNNDGLSKIYTDSTTRTAVSQLCQIAEDGKGLGCGYRSGGLTGLRCELLVNDAKFDCDTTTKKVISEGGGNIDTSFLSVLKGDVSCCPEWGPTWCTCDKQSASCCEKLGELVDGGFDSCLCKIVEGNVASRNNDTLNFLNFARDNSAFAGTCPSKLHRSEYIGFTRRCYRNPAGNADGLKPPEGVQRYGWVYRRV